MSFLNNLVDSFKGNNNEEDDQYYLDEDYYDEDEMIMRRMNRSRDSSQISAPKRRVRLCRQTSRQDPAFSETAR